MPQFHRRDFLKTAAAAAAALAFSPHRLFAAASPPAARLFVVQGTDVPRMLEAGIQALGGWHAFIRPGQKLTLKPNVGWASTPEQGANTNPEVVEACIRSGLAAGAATVVLPENPCSAADKSFAMSGIGAVARRTGARLYEPQAGRDFQDVVLPKAKILKRAAVVKDVLETDCLINMPVPKSHGGGIMTAGMKNWMGSVQDRGFWHRNGLHQCIADFSTFIRPALVIVDATRIMVTNGPRGPGRMETPNQLVFGTDPVAVDAYVATLFRREPFSIPYIQIAHDMGIGCGDLPKVAVRHIVA
ncbi:MAG: DUF362 domain-containing protein [Lentisphaerae bacterium]|nr:DUF362 domain-containing protein [Lentisphaerota bacterium]